MAGIDLGQLRTLIVRPVLQYIELWSPAAENLLIGTALMESRGEYIHQLGAGPACGLWQMEPVTHDDIWENFLKYKPRLAGKVMDFNTQAVVTDGANEMTGNLFYGAAMCRVHYYRKPEAVPAERDALGMAQLWKLRYNTPQGAGTVEQALPYFRTACGV